MVKQNTLMDREEKRIIFLPVRKQHRRAAGHCVAIPVLHVNTTHKQNAMQILVLLAPCVRVIRVRKEEVRCMCWVGGALYSHPKSFSTNNTTTEIKNQTMVNHSKEM